jgi:hypothetical protein
LLSVSSAWPWLSLYPSEELHARCSLVVTVARRQLARFA